MKLADLRAKGGVVDRAPVAKEVTWTRVDAEGVEQSDTFTIHVARQSVGAMERMFFDDPNDPDRSRSANVISKSIRLGKGGEEAISYEEAYQLEPSLAAVFLKAFREVNGQKEKAENPPQPTSSGTS